MLRGKQFVSKQRASLKLRPLQLPAWDNLMVPLPQEEMCSSFSTSVIQLIECFVILSSTALLSSIMERALVILLNLSTSQLTYNSLESSAMLTVPSMSAVSDTESALQDAVMGILSERLAWAALIATLTYTAMFNSQELANTLFSLASYATHLTCVTWAADVGLTLVKRPAANAWSISPYQQDLVSSKTADNIPIAIYANSPQDLLMCSDGYGALDSKILLS
jgi:hypothetical protein